MNNKWLVTIEIAQDMFFEVEADSMREAKEKAWELYHADDVRGEEGEVDIRIVDVEPLEGCFEEQVGRMNTAMDASKYNASESCTTKERLNNKSDEDEEFFN